MKKPRQNRGIFIGASETPVELVTAFLNEIRQCPASLAGDLRQRRCKFDLSQMAGRYAKLLETVQGLGL